MSPDPPEKDVFVFRRRILRVVGVDENGYGPRVGPLVVTRVVIRYEGEDPLEDLDLSSFVSLPIQDSKVLFRRSLPSYARGERAALMLLREIGGIPASTTDLWARIAPEMEQRLETTPYGANITLPVWATPPLPHLRLPGITVEDIRVRIFLPEHLRGKNKLQVNLQAFLHHVEASRPDVALLGKIGGMRRYGPHLPPGAHPVEETPERSWYRLGRRDMLFVRNADARYLPVAMASVVGKYVRELLMLSLNRALGHEDPLPWASGYHHDPRSHTLVEEARRRGWDVTRP